MLWQLGNLLCSSGEKWKQVALSRLIMNLAICDSPWAAVQALISESMSVSWEDYGNRVPHGSNGAALLMVGEFS